MTPAKLEKTRTIYGSVNAGEMASPNAELTAKVDMNTACKIDFIPAVTDAPHPRTTYPRRDQEEPKEYQFSRLCNPEFYLLS